MKKLSLMVGVVSIIGLACALMFTECGICQSDSAKAEGVSASPVKVNNTVCPVTGDPVNMKNPITVEYKGKIYNLCCPMCIALFKADPEKYISKIKAGEPR